MIREYREDDLVAVEEVYRLAFAGPPWHEQLSEEEVARRWQKCISERGFGCLVAEIGGQVIGFTCWDEPTLAGLAKERGQALADFAARRGRPVVWLRETCVAPDYQGQGVARRLKSAVVLNVSGMARSYLALTRMRDDNTGIIRLNELFGFRRTGIRVPSSQVPGLFHEYWYQEWYRGEW